MNIRRRLECLEAAIAALKGGPWGWVTVDQCARDPDLFEFEGKAMTPDQIQEAVGPRKRLLLIFLSVGRKGVKDEDVED